MAGSRGSAVPDDPTVPAHTVDGPVDAPVLVLGASLGTTGELWAPQMPALTARFRVVRYAHPGHGAPLAPDDGSALGIATIADLGAGVLALLDHLGVGSASMAGISLGGMVALWVAANAPERVDRLALCCTGPYLPPAAEWHARAAAVRAEGTAPLLDRLLGRWFTPGFPADHPEAADLVARMLAAVDPEGYAHCCEALAGMDLRPALAAVTAPTLVLAGRDDPVCPPAMALALHEGIAGSSLVVLPGAAHLANVEQAEAFTAALVDHLAGRPLDRGSATRRAVLGDDHVDAAVAATTPFTAPFQDLITRYAWGEVWTRPGLDRARRSCITLAMLVALGRFDELALHVRAARRNGLSPDEIGEVLLQTAIYCGAPAARSAFAVAERVLAAEIHAGDDRDRD
jgi:3-oxoadipate enol-lactonase/4-carboxymuconolactone decarboxylase